MSKKKKEEEEIQGVLGYELGSIVTGAETVEQKGVFINDFPAGSVITIRTRDYTYHMMLIDPKTGKVEVTTSRGDHKDSRVEKISGPIHALGSSLTGTGAMVKSKWIAVGFSFQLGYEIQELEPGLLSIGLNLQQTESVSVNGKQILPDPLEVKKGLFN